MTKFLSSLSALSFFLPVAAFAYITPDEFLAHTPLAVLSVTSTVNSRLQQRIEQRGGAIREYVDTKARLQEIRIQESISNNSSAGLKGGVRTRRTARIQARARVHVKTILRDGSEGNTIGSELYNVRSSRERRRIVEQLRTLQKKRTD